MSYPTDFDFLAHLRRQRDWSGKTFGPSKRTKGVLDHIRKELAEIEAKPDDLSEWIDVVILALDGAWRHGGSPQDIIDALEAKQRKNEARVWPDWRALPEDRAIEHDRSEEPVAEERLKTSATGRLHNLCDAFEEMDTAQEKLLAEKDQEIKRLEDLLTASFPCNLGGCQSGLCFEARSILAKRKAAPDA